MFYMVFILWQSVRCSDYGDRDWLYVFYIVFILWQSRRCSDYGDRDCLYVFYMVFILWQPRRCSDCWGWGLFVCVLHGVHFVAAKEMF